MDSGGKGSPADPRRRRREEVTPSPPHGPSAGKTPPPAPEPESQADQAADAARSPSEFFARLSREERQLLLLRDELYDGSWDDMEEDLRRRLNRKPYIYRLMNRIEEDLRRIARLRAYEEAQGVDLGVFLKSETDDS